MNVRTMAGPHMVQDLGHALESVTREEKLSLLPQAAIRNACEGAPSEISALTSGPCSEAGPPEQIAFPASTGCGQ